MRTLIVYESAWGNTRAVAEDVAEGMAGDVAPPEVVGVEAAPPLDGLQVELLVVGAPTHAFGLSREGTREDAHKRGGDLLTTGVRDWLGAATGAGLGAATFDTHVSHTVLPGRASRSAAKKLKRLGCQLVVGPESFYVDDYGGPLLPGELERARAWG